MIPDNVRPSPSGIKKIFFMGGGPGAGKGGISKRDKSGIAPTRSDDPDGYKRPLVPVVQEWLEDGTLKPLDGKQPEGVMINPDDLKMQLPEAQAAHLRLIMKDEEGDSVRLAGGDKGWAGEVHEESSLLAKILTRRAMERDLDIVVDGTGDDTLEKMIKKVEAAKGRGYITIGTYINAQPEEAIGGAMSRQYTTKRSVSRKIQVDTFINLAKMLIPTGKKEKDGKPVPDSILSGVFDEFVLYDRREIGEPPYIVGHSEAGSDFKANGDEGQLILDAVKSYVPEIGASKDSSMTKEKIFDRLDKAGRLLGNRLVREKKAKALQRRSQTLEMRLQQAEEKGELLEANNIRNRMKINQIAAAVGMTPNEVIRNPKVAFMLKRGATEAEIINYLRDMGNN